MWRLAVEQRVLLFIPARSSSSGHAPIHENRLLGQAKVAAVAPTSAIICCAESGPRPGTYRSTRTLRIRQSDDFNFSIEFSISPLWPAAMLAVSVDHALGGESPEMPSK